MEDLLEVGVLDPAKVTRSGLMNACGIAGIMLTTQVCFLQGVSMVTVAHSMRFLKLQRNVACLNVIDFLLPHRYAPN